MGELDSLLTILLGGGTAAFFTAIFQGYKQMRDGANSRLREAIQDLERWRDEADDRRIKAERREQRALEERDLYREYVGDLLWSMRQAGIDNPLPRLPDPRSRRRPEEPRGIEGGDL